MEWAGGRGRRGGALAAACGAPPAGLFALRALLARGAEEAEGWD